MELSVNSTPWEPTDCAHADRGEAILVVEDEDEVRKVICLTLEMQGYRVLAAHSAEYALQLVMGLTEPIDLLLTDVIMPSMSGPELVEAVRLRQPNIRVLYMSGYSDESLEEHGMSCPHEMFMAKPFSSGELGRKLRQMLRDLA